MIHKIEIASKITQGVWGGLLSFVAAYILPISNYLTVVILFATIDVAFGIADDRHFDFKKAYKFITRGLGYLFLLIFTITAATLLRESEETISVVVSWETYVMIYFFGTNILRNWNKLQPDNKVVSFLYWVLSFKIVEKIKWLKEFQEKEDDVQV